jgi:hypothetical protein
MDSALVALTNPLFRTRLCATVLFVADLFHPVGTLAVQHLHDGDMGHRGGSRGAIPSR